jgi:hypothetical protein
VAKVREHFEKEAGIDIYEMPHMTEMLRKAYVVTV